MQEISHFQKIFVDSRRLTPRGPLLASRPGTRGGLARVRNLLFSLHGEPGTRLRVREARTALPGEGVTQAPLIVSKVEHIALKEGVGYSG
jgi:hypothetical protein